MGVVSRMIRRTSKQESRLMDRYRRFRVQEYCRASFEEYSRDPRFYEQVVDALRSGRALQREAGGDGWRIVG